jgi:hypothetical protein
MKKLLLFISITFFVKVNAQNSVKNNLSAANCSTCSGTYTWNVSSAINPSIMISGPGLVRDLQLTNYSFTIPSTASITGINVQFNHLSMFPHPNALNDTLASLLKGGTVVGNSKHSLTPAYNSTVGTSVSIGGPGDLWGTTWTPTEINASNFGFNFKLFLNPVGNVDLKIQQGFVITIYYTTATGINESQTKTAESINVLDDKMSFNNFNLIGSPYVKIFDISGKQIIKVNTKETSIIDLSDFESGVYFYSYDNSQKVISKKFTIK